MAYLFFPVILFYQVLFYVFATTAIHLFNYTLKFICIFFLSLLLYKKLKTICFISGLCSLSMLFALEFSKFESYGRFNNSAIGVYLGLLTMIITIAAFILLLRKETFLADK